MKKTFLLLSLIALGSLCSAQVDPVAVAGALKSARPGDTITVLNGTYNNVALAFTGMGEAARPIVIMAQTPGGVVLSGMSSLRLAGKGVEVSGFVFKNGFAPRGAVIEYRSGTDVAEYCRITACVIEGYNPPSRETENSWVLMYGRNNRFDHNSIVGKLNNGVTFAVILDEERNTNNNHLIDHNYFGRRPNLGSNGGETIRIGTSQSSLLSSRTRLERNYFEQCDGEVEIVSIKSCDNMIRNNTFYESAGVVALRHGHRNIIEGNAFIGNNKPHTGGIRVINEGHKITNNYFYQLSGDRFFAALAIMNAVPNSLPNRYHQVKDVVIENNVWVDCANIQFGVGKDNERTLAPANVLLANNTFYNKKKPGVYTAFGGVGGFIFRNNLVATSREKMPPAGFIETKILPSNPATAAVKKTACGAPGYQETPRQARVLSGKRIPVLPGQNSLITAVRGARAGDVIEVSREGEYLVDGSIEITKYLRIEGAKNLKTKPVIRYNGTRSRIAVFTIADGGILELSGIAFNDEAFEGRTAASAAISPAAMMSGTYSAYISHCAFYNYGESSYAPFKAARNSYADTLVFSDCLFRDMSGDAISLAAEKEDAGKYSAEYVVVKNCAFYKVLGYAVDLYRGGSDESTTGPAILFENCVLEDVNNKERGAGMRLYGAQKVQVRNTVFSNTGRGGASIRFDETHWDKISVSHCSLYNSGKIHSFWGHVITGPMFTVKPSYTSVRSYDFSSSTGAPLNNKGMNGQPIGLAKESDRIF